MGSTGLSAIYQPDAISAYVTASLPDRLVLLQSGAAVNDLSALAGQGGPTVSVRKWKDFSTAAILDDGAGATPSALASQKEIANITRRRFVFAVDMNTIPALGPGVNALQEIANQSTYRWTREIESAANSVLVGLFDNSAGILRTTHRNSIGVSSGTVVPASIGAIIDTVSLLGDNMADLAIALAHPKVIADLLKESAAKVESVAMFSGDGQNVTMPRINGITYYATQQGTVTGSGAYKLYQTFFLRRSAMSIGYQQSLANRMVYSALYNREEISEDLPFFCHVYGTTYGGSPSSAAGPTNAELATAASYTKAAANDKEIGVACLLSNASKQ